MTYTINLSLVVENYKWLQFVDLCPTIVIIIISLKCTQNGIVWIDEDVATATKTKTTHRHDSSRFVRFDALTAKPKKKKRKKLHDTKRKWLKFSNKFRNVKSSVYEWECLFNSICTKLKVQPVLSIFRHNNKRVVRWCGV